MSWSTMSAVSVLFDLCRGRRQSPVQVGGGGGAAGVIFVRAITNQCKGKGQSPVQVGGGGRSSLSEQ